VAKAKAAKKINKSRQQKSKKTASKIPKKTLTTGGKSIKVLGPVKKKYKFKSGSKLLH
jgi:hypothetical protein